MKLYLCPDDDLVNKTNICLFESISCYSYLMTFNFKVHQDAHFRISLYFIDLLVIGQVFLRHLSLSNRQMKILNTFFHANSVNTSSIFATYPLFT